MWILTNYYIFLKLNLNGIYKKKVLKNETIIGIIRYYDSSYDFLIPMSY